MTATRSSAASADAVVRELRALGSEENRAGMARFGINTERAFGLSMATLRPFQHRHRGDHAMALALWDTGFHEARILAAPRTSASSSGAPPSR